MTLEELQSTIAAALKSEFSMHIHEDQFGTPLTEVSGFTYDSLRVVEIASLLEEKFDIEIDAIVDDLQYNFNNLDRIAKLVHGKLLSMESATS